jgi:hypothetical protein
MKQNSYGPKGVIVHITSGVFVYLPSGVIFIIRKMVSLFNIPNNVYIHSYTLGNQRITLVFEKKTLIKSL